jgi:Tol biopolymer transport system component
MVFTVWQPNGRGDLYVMNADGSNRRRLTNTRANESRPAWSPRGGKIAFQRGNSVWLMDPNGTNAHRLVWRAREPTWSPGGSFLAFSRIREFGEFEAVVAIYTVRRDGTGVTRILTPEFDRDVAWSPDGAKVAFTSVRPFSQSGVYVADADGSDETFVQTGASPAWSPDSSQIVFADVDGLYVADADGSDPVKLPAPLDSSGDPLRHVREPGWRPDGGAVSFVASETGECPEVYTMALDGTAVTQVTAAACAPEVGSHAWVPGGASIVLGGTTCDEDFECTSQIFSAAVPGGTPVALTEGTDFTSDGDPAVSPDGTKVAFTRFDFTALADWDVWVMDADGSDETKLTSGGADLAPAWQTLPD